MTNGAAEFVSASRIILLAATPARGQSGMTVTPRPCGDRASSAMGSCAGGRMAATVPPGRVIARASLNQCRSAAAPIDFAEAFWSSGARVPRASSWKGGFVRT